MVTRGSKYFIGAGFAALLIALLYGFLTETASQSGVIGVASGDGGIIDAVIGPLSFGWKGGVGDHIGYGVLMTFAAVMFVTAGFTSAFRDADADSLKELTVASGASESDAEATIAVTAPVGLNYWPVLAAVSIGLILIGTVYSTALIVIGGVLLIVSTFEWTVRAWSERATGDPAANRILRNKILYPIELPIGSLLILALIGYCVSRVLLAVSPTGAVIYIIVLAATVFALGYFLSTRRDLSRSVVVSIIVLIGAVVIGGGIAGAIAGPREHHSQGIYSELPVEGAAANLSTVAHDTSETY